MRVIVTSEQRFLRTPDGKVWTETVDDCRFWSRYLEVFEEVIVFARLLDTDAIRSPVKRADGPRVGFFAVPHYIGPWQYLRRALSLTTAAKELLEGNDAVIMRVSTSQIANSVERMVSRARRPYALEVIGDPYEVYARGGVRGPLRPFLRQWFTLNLKRQCKSACAVAYVTDHALQQRYPSSAASMNISDVEIPETGSHRFKLPALGSEVDNGERTEALRAPQFRSERPVVITVGSLAQPYKGVDTLIRAVAKCFETGRDLDLHVIGDGRYRSELEALARGMRISRLVKFKGQLIGGEAVEAELDMSDLFVLASRTEGLPKAMIEAMARGLPCLGTAVGGIPELLHPEDLVPKNDSAKLANLIERVLSDPDRRRAMSLRNLRRASDFRPTILNARRKAFYHRIRNATESWIDSGASSRESADTRLAERRAR